MGEDQVVDDDDIDFDDDYEEKKQEGAKMLRYRAADGIEKSAKSAVAWMQLPLLLLDVLHR